jgi:hypothetical protein
MSTDTYVPPRNGVEPIATRPNLVRWIPMLGLAGFVLAVVVGTLLAPPSYRTLRDTISVLAAVDNPNGPIMVAGFVALGAGLVVNAGLLWRTLPTWSGRAAAVLVGIAGAATTVAGFGRVACNPALAQCQAALDQSTPTSTLVHFRAAMFVFTPLVIAGFVLVRAVWRTGRRRAAMWGLAAALLDVVETYLVLNDLTPVTGLLQRTLLLSLYGLPITVPLVITPGRPR